MGFGGAGTNGFDSIHVGIRRPAFSIRLLCELLQIPYFQSTMLPAASSEAVTSVVIAGPNGSHVCSCSRIHCTRTGLPGTARAISAASAAASSAPLCP